MKRGDIVIVSLPGDYGKPRPAVVLQNDRLEGRLESYIIALMTTFDEGARLLRVDVAPSAENGLKQVSKIMVDKLYAIPEHRMHQHIGKLDRDSLRRIDRALMMILDLDPLKPG
ncbi:type II toxin-antitoxin system PemK/MazF family toxin [Mesorhizobium sp. LHD-90]|uniref:type II toxin-antitoxin system PemK/MazF family toxin n=1 Tax=Mesorhizobium sp. LHD-90 TaxID=3071414 RepID=UPI0027DF70E4|nr:type II toxin-antitoxin system PemK/MazF family toxin [Mesorhizobium sp. LHD-90]MDQ6433407.1 type II toxin-antitoxin system PemK/MazF family toxin [Mesorhizobium sp. LHD-90]